MNGGGTFTGACGKDVMIDTNSIEIAYGIKFLDKDCTYVRLKTGKTIILADEMNQIMKKADEVVSRVEGIVE